MADLRRISTLWILVLGIHLSYSQQVTRIRGVVTDASTGEPLPFVNITFRGLPTGTITDISGFYKLETRFISDSLLASSLGYKTSSSPIRLYTEQQINFALVPDQIALEEVVIKPGENPAHILLRNIIANKKKNNLSELSSWKYESYNKIRIDITNVEDIQKRKFLKSFNFVFDKIDTLQESGKTFLPLLLSETVSENYFQSKPKKSKEYITASKISGTQNESMAQLTGKLYQEYNIYNNVLSLFEIGWISPLSEYGLLFYKYHLKDTSEFSGKTCYQIQFEPRRKHERTFTGNFWVVDSLWAVQSYDMAISEEANINFMRDLAIRQEFRPISDSLWFPYRDEMVVEINLTDRTTGMIGRKVIYYKDIQVDVPIDETILKEPTDLVVVQGAGKTTSDFWDSTRPENLSDQEAGIYQMIDSIQQVPLYKSVSGIMGMLYTYYYVMGPFEYGPYYRTYSYNPIEGNRFRIGGRTSNSFSTNLMLEGYIAYGTRDDRVKYGGGATYMLDKNPRSSMGFWYEYDMKQLGQSDNAFLEDNFATSLLRRNPNYKLTMTEEYRIFYEKEWFQGFSNTLTLRHRTLYPTQYIPFNIENGPELLPIPSLKTAEIKINTRFAWQEKYISGEFERASLGTKWPIINVNFTFGIPGIYGSSYKYQRYDMNITDDVEMFPFGYLRYTFDAGFIKGTLPYPLLELHKGNETYAFDYMAFNMMNYYEFVSDKYLSIFAEHHFDGFFLNHIPLMRKLKLREVATARALIGGLSEENSMHMQLPEGLGNVKKGYYELGVGIENIFKVVRLDAVWRLSYLNHANIKPFGLRASVQLVL